MLSTTVAPLTRSQSGAGALLDQLADLDDAADAAADAAAANAVANAKIPAKVVAAAAFSAIHKAPPVPPPMDKRTERMVGWCSSLNPG